jgi:hypothetical protein
MRLPKCAIRPRCRWWKERGIEACRRCPTIITRDYQPTTAMASAAAPAAKTVVPDSRATTSPSLAT